MATKSGYVSSYSRVTTTTQVNNIKNSSLPQGDNGVKATNASVESGSRYTSGWGSRFDSRRAVLSSDGRTFEEIRAQCLKDKRLFEDPDFPAKDTSIFFSRSPPRPFEWKRPRVSKELAHLLL